MDVLARTDAQRRFDAIRSLFLGAVSAPLGSVAPEPVVNLFMNIDESGIPIDPYDAVMASLTGWFRRVIVDSAGVVIDL